MLSAKELDSRIRDIGIRLEKIAQEMYDLWMSHELPRQADAQSSTAQTKESGGDTSAPATTGLTAGLISALVRDLDSAVQKEAPHYLTAVQIRFVIERWLLANGFAASADGGIVSQPPRSASRPDSVQSACCGHTPTDDQSVATGVTQPIGSRERRRTAAELLLGSLEEVLPTLGAEDWRVVICVVRALRTAAKQ